MSPGGRLLAVPLLYNKGIVNTRGKKNTDTTTNMEQPPPDSPAALPLFTTGRGDMPPNHRAASPLRVGAGREPSGLRSPTPVPLFGAPEWHPSKMREAGGALTSTAAV